MQAKPKNVHLFSGVVARRDGRHEMEVSEEISELVSDKKMVVGVFETRDYLMVTAVDVRFERF
jgi:hypothetical protein